MLKGVEKLPVQIEYSKAIDIMELLSVVSNKIGKLSMLVKNSPISHHLIELASYNESVQSTKIEGTQVTFREIMEVKDNKSLTISQREVINYKLAIDYAYEQVINEKNPITSKLIKEIHRILMKKSRGVCSGAGEFRKIQNYIGKSKDIKDAVYIPVDANQIEEYITNLEFFINGENHRSFEIEKKEGCHLFTYDAKPLVKMAIAHAQFESIHPFLDGNGRIGRILIVLMAMKYNLLDKPLFFVSEELEKERIRYYNTLNSTRNKEPNWYEWIMFFLKACERTADKLVKKIRLSENLYYKWKQECKTANQEKILYFTFLAPVTTVKNIQNLSGYHVSTVKKAFEYFVEKGFLVKDCSTKRNVKYFNYDILKIFAE